MPLKIRQNSIGGQILLYLVASEQVAASLISLRSNIYRYAKGLPAKNLSAENTAIFRLIKWGLIELVQEDSRQYYRLTKKGEVEALILKTKMPIKEKWDGRWRMVIFDIPEEAANERDQLRRLLIRNNFRKLQASVYISPYAINREAIVYLKETGLIKYIRFARIDELDEDKDLKKIFGL